MGSVRYGQYPQFDNLQLYSTQTPCGATPAAAGVPISLVQCSSEVGAYPGSSFDFHPNATSNQTGVFALRSNENLCIALVPVNQPNGETLPFPVQLAACNPADPNQQWTQAYQTPYQTEIQNTATGRCLDIYGQIAEIGHAIDAWPCNGQAFYYDYLPGEIINIGATVCLGVC
jgi:hypothetical protein